MINHMVDQSPDGLDRVFGALSDPTRRAMLRRLAGGARTVSELAEPFDMSFAAAAKHVKVLERAGLLSRTIEGRSHRCRIEASPWPQPIAGWPSTSASGRSDWTIWNAR
jgi:DNA-binding transcriptional ArsR family regulator